MSSARSWVCAGGSFVFALGEAGARIGRSPTDLTLPVWGTIFESMYRTFVVYSCHFSYVCPLPFVFCFFQNKHTHPHKTKVGDYSTSVGFLGFPYQTNGMISVSDKIDELSTMITAGRLSAENKQVMLVRFIKRIHFPHVRRK